MTSNYQRGFTHVMIVALVVILLVVGGTGYYVWRSNHQSVANNTSATAQISGSTQSPTTTHSNQLTQFFLKNSKLKLAYASTIWNINASNSSIDPTCGPEDNLSLAYKHSTFLLDINLGQACGKGGGICLHEADSGCIAQSKELAAVNLSASKTVYALAHRVTTDNGKNWSYDLALNDTNTCTDGICGFTAEHITANPSIVSGIFEGEGSMPGNPQTLSAFSALPEVKAAVTVLKTLHY